jgi:hypothetical protein
MAAGKEFWGGRVDPQTNRTYVLISEDIYQRIKGLINED